VNDRAFIAGALSLLLCACGAEEAAIPAPDPPPAQGGGTATLNWSIPTQNTDDTPLTNLMGFRVYHGTSASSLSPLTTITSPSATSTVIGDLPPGMHYFAVSAVTTSGAESVLSPVRSKAIP
jgi:hypothetical protein